MSQDDTQLPSADALTTEGLEAAKSGRIVVLACGALAREILDVLASNNFDHIDLQCLPAIFHNHPEKIVPAVEKAVGELRQHYDEIFLAYADCGTGGQLQAAADRLGIEMIAGPHCYSFFEGNDTFARRSETEFTAFYLTDFLVRQFEAFVWKPLGLDRHPELRDMYFGHYEKLVYQAQTEDPELTEKAKDCAKRLGLEFERRFTGYGDLKTALQSLDD
ncbi:MAG: DUF1638 domain-containing protein [Boseongicola sp.]|nr:DUF1638 domain-containing protein [Boseongicola sp.]MDD9978777.1 DUF1638 domain-containing protein [Boseongicola sp.]